MSRALIVLAVLLTACGSDSAVGPTELVGAWNLVTVDGKALPVNILAPTSTSCGVDVQSGSVNLTNAGKYSSSESYGTVINGKLYCNALAEESGTYTVSGNVITLRNGFGGQTRTLTIDGNALVKTFESRRYVYHR